MGQSEAATLDVLGRNNISSFQSLYVGLGIVLSALGYHGRFQPHHTKENSSAQW